MCEQGLVNTRRTVRLRLRRPRAGWRCSGRRARRARGRLQRLVLREQAALQARHVLVALRQRGVALAHLADLPRRRPSASGPTGRALLGRLARPLRRGRPPAFMPAQPVAFAAGQRIDGASAGAATRVAARSRSCPSRYQTAPAPSKQGRHGQPASRPAGQRARCQLETRCAAVLRSYRVIQELAILMRAAPESQCAGACPAAWPALRRPPGPRRAARPRPPPPPPPAPPRPALHARPGCPPARSAPLPPGSPAATLAAACERSPSPLLHAFK